MKKTIDVDHYNCFPSINELTLDGSNNNSVSDQTDPIPQPSSTIEDDGSGSEEKRKGKESKKTMEKG